ncbi:MAG: hypothetical protein ABIP38_01545 [Steroidobacteraceae bacterium]
MLRSLDLEAGSEPGRPAWLSAASGLVATGGELCVVADDELHLGRFSFDPSQRGQLLRLFPGDLPDGEKKRKKRKPDLEVLMHLPANKDYPHGALLALGSGSGEHRCRGALVALGVDGGITGRPRTIDAEALYARLSRSFDDLNLEGGWVSNDRLHLLQRGNKGDSPNAVLQWELTSVVGALLRDRSLPDVDPMQMRMVDLGDIRGIPLGFTDATPLPDGGCLFSAVAENTTDSRIDGPCVAAVIGRMDGHAQVRWIRPILPLCKIEGIALRQESGMLQVLLVTDADDPSARASLLQAEL